LITLALVIAGYVMGLFVFYTFACFDTQAWDVLYFGWAKTFDIGLVMWGYLYFNGSPTVRKVTKWFFVFACARLICDIQTFFTDVGVNNTPAIAGLFLWLLIVVCYVTLIEATRPERKGRKR
jgi:hypothetical protein